jgi:copper type II ascorbate-dependent monooxygenase-like protein
MRSRRASLLLSALSGAMQLSCSSAGTAPPNKPSPGLEVPAADRGIQLGFQVKTQPGSEIVVCRELVLPGDAAIEVDRVEHASSPGTHHIHAYRTSTPADKVSPDVFDCGDLAGPLFYTAEKEGDSTHFHPGVGLKFGRGEVVRLELHYLNTGSAPAEADLRINLWFADHPLTTEAGSFLMYDHAIDVPPHGSATTRMHCEIPSDISITSLLPHVHTHGTGERIYLSGGDLSEPRLLVDSRGYGDLETRTFDPTPVLVKAGQALDFECDFKNDTAKGLIEGTSPTTAEMCVILGSYYPRLPPAAEWCTLPGSGPLP